MGRKRFVAEDKVRLLRRHLLDKVAVSEICEEHGIQPTVFYRWQKQFFENGASAFDHKSSKKKSRESDRVAALESKLRKKDEVISELMEDHVKLKKELGEL